MELEKVEMYIMDTHKFYKMYEQEDLRVMPEMNFDVMDEVATMFQQGANPHDGILAILNEKTLGMLEQHRDLMLHVERVLESYPNKMKYLNDEEKMNFTYFLISDLFKQCWSFLYKNRITEEKIEKFLKVVSEYYDPAEKLDQACREAKLFLTTPDEYQKGQPKELLIDGMISIIERTCSAIVLEDRVIMERPELLYALSNGFHYYDETEKLWFEIDILDIAEMMRLTRYYIAFVSAVTMERNDMVDRFNRTRTACRIRHFS